MLYHPCAHHAMVDQLRRVVAGCIRKRVITAYAKLTTSRVREEEVLSRLSVYYVVSKDEIGQG